MGSREGLAMQKVEHGAAMRARARRPLAATSALASERLSSVAGLAHSFATRRPRPIHRELVERTLYPASRADALGLLNSIPCTRNANRPGTEANLWGSDRKRPPKAGM